MGLAAWFKILDKFGAKGNVALEDIQDKRQHRENLVWLS